MKPPTASLWDSLVLKITCRRDAGNWSGQHGSGVPIMTAYCFCVTLFFLGSGGEETVVRRPYERPPLWLLCSQIKFRWCSRPTPSTLSPPSSLTVTSTFLPDHTRHISHPMSTPSKVSASGCPDPCHQSSGHVREPWCHSRCAGVFALCESKMHLKMCTVG